MAYHLFGVKPLSELIVAYFWFNKFQINLTSNLNIEKMY